MHGHIILPSKGMATAVANKISVTFKKDLEETELQKLLKQIQLPHNFKTRA
jgi:hypothetical protein